MAASAFAAMWRPSPTIWCRAARILSARWSASRAVRDGTLRAVSVGYRVAETPTVANRQLQLIKQMMQFAVERGWRPDNPARDVRKLRHKSDGHHSWSEDEIAQYEARHPLGSRARLAVALLLYTGQRRSDVIRMGRQHVRDCRISVVQQKTGARLSIPLHPRLVEAMDASPSDHLTFITTEFGKPFTAAGFGNWFRDRCREAGLPEGCTAHGLRKAAARRLAEAGCSPHEIAAITGHQTLREVERYTRAADQTRLASAAFARIGDRKRNPE